MSYFGFNPKLLEILEYRFGNQGITFSGYEDKEFLEVYKNNEYICTLSVDGTVSCPNDKVINEQAQGVSEQYKEIRNAYLAYSNSAYMHDLIGAAGYKSLCEYGDHVLAAKLLSNMEFEYAIWQCDHGVLFVHNGTYFSDFNKAQENFAVRSGLMDKWKMLDESEWKLIRTGLVFLAMNCGDITTEQNVQIGKLINRIDVIVPEVQKHEVLEHQGLVADDGLEI